MSAGVGWRARHASRTAFLGSELSDGSVSQTGLHHCHARNSFVPFSGPVPTLTEAFLR